MSAQAGELEALAAETRTKKGRMDAGGRKKAAALIAAIWTDPNEDPEATLQYLGDLKAEALADGIRMCWNRMGDDRRKAFEQWLPLPNGERDIRRLAFLISSVLETDPPTAIRWLSILIPAERKTVTKEIRQHLAASLFGEADFDFHGLAADAQRPAETYRVFGLLWNIATDPAFSVPKMGRVRLARAIVGFRPSDESDRHRHTVLELYSKIREDAVRWPSALRQEFEFTQSSPQSPEPALEDSTQDRGRASDPSDESSMTLTPTPSTKVEPEVPSSALNGSGPRLDSPSPLQTRLALRIAALPDEIALLHTVQTTLSALTDERERLRRDVAAAEHQTADLRNELSEARSARDVARADAVQRGNQANRLSNQVTLANEEFESERKRLAQQINTNAAGRIEEYKTKLGLTLSRLVKDLPEKQASVSPELGKVLLLQFHQFLDALRQEGIDVQQGANSR